MHKSPASVILDAALDARKVRDMADSSDYHQVGIVLSTYGKRSAVALADSIARQYASIARQWTAA